ncbi:hypothetical protein SAMN05660909_00246 [Chitinophaga terrae (ex Kim and Jung 2007)]|uniref:Uncharacterized protein n=1 Tax=Chitinophaga terrae (ex Kim and Jung 2007) TaxID=408074 RepID=A0A1H3X5B5_9BACT|nr:hypothetical protein [Chitinophaga terrae (ex Kim and Jung 2007)]MDQ0106915.1 hypothetical protein [Chitinophaga terrae (ex Kim and Jung 2007)]SDZ93854.1 hypothetical protein SAMN05660909_00246 [Chitinophaga terrae (ex Kim and Jung 2007)]
MKIFYADYVEQHEIPFDNGVEMDREKALQSFSELTDFEDNFWGLFDDADRTLQFMSTGDDWLADIPDSSKGGSYVKHCTFDECLLLIREAYEKNKVEVPAGFEFEKW